MYHRTLLDVMQAINKLKQRGAQSFKDSVKQFFNECQKVIHNRNERCHQLAQRCDQCPMD